MILCIPKKARVPMPITQSRGIVIRELTVDTVDNNSNIGPETQQGGVIDKKGQVMAIAEDVKGKDGQIPAGVEEGNQSFFGMENTSLVDPGLISNMAGTFHGMNQDVEDEEDPTENSTYKSIFSRGSVANKLGAMNVKLDDMSVTDSGKRKQAEFERDTASLPMKKNHNEV